MLVLTLKSKKMNTGEPEEVMVDDVIIDDVEPADVEEIDDDYEEED